MPKKQLSKSIVKLSKKLFLINMHVIRKRTLAKTILWNIIKRFKFKKNIRFLLIKKIVIDK